MIHRASLGPDEISGAKLPVVDPQLAVKEVQLFNASMPVRRIVGSWRQPYKHRYTARLLVNCKDLAEDAFCHFFPFGDRVQWRWWQHRLSAVFVRDSLRKALP